MPLAFDNLCGLGKPLRAEPPNAEEFAGFKRSGLSRLKDSGTTSLSLESRFDLGYNAAHALCVAALRWHGYRSGNTGTSSFSCCRTPWVSAPRQCRDRAVEDHGAMIPLHVQLQNSTIRGVIKRLRFPLDVMLVCVRWYAAYPLSLRNLEEMMAERGVLVDHATVHRWALKMLPAPAKVYRRRQVPVGRSWRVDETYVPVSGQWKYLYRAVDRLGQTVDFLLTTKRDEAAAHRFFEKAIDVHDVPEKVTIDKSGANTAAVQSLAADSGLGIELRQSKYLNNLVEQDHRAIKRRVRPMMGFGRFATAAKLIAGIETMQAIKKGQLGCHQGLVVSDADRFYSLATR